MSIAATPLVTKPPLPESAAPAIPGGAAGRGQKGPDFTFHDFLSILNPLQHIPVVSTIYRAVTGDTIKPAERLVGDTIYGGWMGFVSSLANLVYERETGKDFGDTVLAFVEDKTHTTMFAKNSGHTATAANTNAPAQNPVLASVKPRIVAPAQTFYAAPASAKSIAQLPASLSAAAKPAEATRTPTIPAAAADPANDSGVSALSTSLAGSGVDATLGERAIYAYRRTMGLLTPQPDLMAAY